MCLNLGDLGGQVPATIDELSERTERAAVRVLDRVGPRQTVHGLPGETPSIPAPLEALFCSPGQRRDLAARVLADRYRFDHFQVDVRIEDGPTVDAGAGKRVTLAIRNTSPVQAYMRLRWHVPEGWSVGPAPCGSVLTLPRLLGGAVECVFTIQTVPFGEPVARCMVELAVDARPALMAVPVVFANGGLRGGGVEATC